MSYYFNSARLPQQSKGCSVVKSLNKSLIVFSAFQQFRWVSLYIPQSESGCDF